MSVFSQVGQTGVSVVGGTTGLIKVGGFTPSFVAVTSVGFSQDSATQFMQSLKRVVYVYTFGERMGTIEVSGVVFLRPCTTNPFALANTGVDEIFDFYKEFTVSNRSEPVAITLGRGNRMQGFLRGLRSTFQRPESGMIGFTLIFASLPDLWR